MKKRVIFLLTGLFSWTSVLLAQNVPEAEGTMAAFFSNHKVGSFNVNHQGKRDESGFVIGTLMTANGNFRVNCFFRKVQNKYVIHQIRIDKTDE